MPDEIQRQLSLALTPYINRGLFADNFLEHRLPELPEWQEAKGLEDAFAHVLQLYRDRAARFSRRTNESQTEDDFIKPVLDVLWREQQPRDCYQVQVRIPNLDANRQPDYAMFRCAADRTAADPQLGTIEYWREVPCLGDAKKWTASLDKERGADENPTAQICNYLYRSRVRWGILTNGRHWRLYEREKSSAGGIYFDVDLEGICQHSDRNAFKYFYHFFRREAFLPDQNGVTFLEKVFQGSVEYATEVGDRLKENVYDALRLLMNGFFDHGPNRLDRRDPETLKLVHENSLIVLYRLLFLLYAEDGELLPKTAEPYASYSVYRLQREINQHLRTSGAYPPTARRFWGELTNLFELIDAGFPDGRIPAYNGGLFSPSRHSHVSHNPPAGTKRWEIGDRYLAQAIDLLAYQRERWNEPGSHDVDYATLAVQHLGSIYEGLLELRPHVAEAPLVETLENGKPVFKSRRDVPNPRPIRGQPPREVNRDEVYLVTDRGERKATGSYYTPKYIVDYIVENTVGPLAEAAAKKVAELSRPVTAQIEHLARKRRQFEQEAKKGNGRTAAKDVANIDRQSEAEKRRLLEPYLSLKILDPAMGSGHFLVGAADFLSLAMATDSNLPHTLAGEEDPQGYYKRLVVERCLYGVDLNPLAVELAKLSLWLHTVSKDKSLSFLDHHLRCGNSLIGARIEEDLVREPPVFNAHGRRVNAERAPLFARFDAIFTLASLQSFLDTFRQIVESPGGSADAERHKDELYRIMDAQRQKFRAVAACWLAPYFGVPVTAAQYEQAVHALRGSPADWESLSQEQWFEAAQKVAEEKRFFHWELEFPEAFFARHGSKPDEERGFDAVIGNPPYFNVDVFGKNSSEQKWLKDHYPDVWQDKSDILFYFVAAGLCLTHSQISMIISNAFLASHKAQQLRSFLAYNSRLSALVNFRDFPVFEEAGIATAIASLEKTDPADCAPCLEILDAELSVGAVAEGLKQFAAGNGAVNSVGMTATTVIVPPDGSRWVISDDASRLLCRKIDAAGPDLGSLFTLGEGMQTGCNEAFTLSEQPPREDAAYWRIRVIGEDIGRYTLGEPRVWLIWPQELHPPKDGPRWLQQQLGQWEDALRARAAFQRGDCEWFQYTWPLHAELYGRRKLWCSYRARGNAFAYDPTNQRIGLTNTTVIFDTNRDYDLLYVLSLLNSAVLSLRYRFIGKMTGSGMMEFFENQIRKVPIRRIAFTTPADERSGQLAKCKQLYERYLARGDVDRVLGHVEHQLDQEPEQADVVHDLLAFLAEQMIDLNKQKQKEVSGYLKWLERKIGAAVDHISNKTLLRAYHEQEFTDLLDVLRRNRSKLTVDPDGRAVQDSIEREFNESMARLRPLKAKIAVTDWLIDQIVYRLYGLTDKEIQVVEGERSAAATD